MVNLLISFLVLGGGDLFGLEAEKLAARLKAINELALQGKTQDALEKMNQAIVDYPGNSMLHLNRGWLLYHQDDKDGAIKDFERAAQSDDPEIRYRAAFNRARALYDKGHKVAQDAHLPDSAVDIPKEQDVTPLVAAAQEAAKELTASQDSFVDTLLARPQDRDAKESLEAVSDEAAKMTALLEELKKRQQEQQKDQQKQDQKKKQENEQNQKQGQSDQDQNQDQQQEQKQNPGDQQANQDQQNENPEQKEKDQKGEQKEQQKDKEGAKDPKTQPKDQPKPSDMKGEKGEAKEVPLSPEQVQQLLQTLEDLEQKKKDLDKQRAMAIRGRQKVKKDW